MTSLHVRPSQGPPNATRRAGLAGLALLILVACSSAPPEGTIYVHPNADVLSFERVAILPFENLTNERFASARVREVLAIELSAMGAFEVVDHGEVNRALRQREIVTMHKIGGCRRRIGAVLAAEIVVTVLIGACLAGILTTLTARFGAALMRSIVMG